MLLEDENKLISQLRKLSFEISLFYNLPIQFGSPSLSLLICRSSYHFREMMKILNSGWSYCFQDEMRFCVGNFDFKIFPFKKKISLKQLGDRKNGVKEPDTEYFYMFNENFVGDAFDFLVANHTVYDNIE